MTNKPAGDRDESTTQRCDSDARVELEAAVAVEHEKIARQHLDGEVDGVRSEARRPWKWICVATVLLSREEFVQAKSALTFSRSSSEHAHPRARAFVMTPEESGIIC